MQNSLFYFIFLTSLVYVVSSNRDIQCSRKNEIKSCNGCPPERTCKNRHIRFKCLLEPSCTQSCVCREGFVRDNANECISDKICESCKDPNEFWDCGPACDNECSTLSHQNRTNCPIVNITCNQKCYCKDGFARNDKGACVLIDRCKN